MDRLLCLDLGTTSAVAWGAAGTEPRWQTMRFRGEDSGEIHDAFRSWLVQLITDLRPTIVVFEAPFVGRFIRTAERLLYMKGCVEEVCARARRSGHMLRCRQVTPLEVSRFLLGATPRRAEKKRRTIEAVRAYGFPVEDDNSADAIAVFLMTEATVAPALAARRGFGTLFPAQQRGAA